MDRPNPYQSPIIIEPETVEELPASLRAAIWRGVKRGAKFGGTVAGLIVLALYLLAVLTAAAMTIYALWKYGGREVQATGGWRILLTLIGGGLVAVLIVAAQGAAVGAFIMGLAAASRFLREQRRRRA